METQKPMVDLSQLEYATKGDLSHHDHHPHHGSTNHLFDSSGRKKSHDVLPYSLYLMNNNWHSDPHLTASEFKWTYSDYMCGLVLGIVLFLGLAATELVSRYWGKIAVIVYLVSFILLYFLLITRFFIIHRRK